MLQQPQLVRIEEKQAVEWKLETVSMDNKAFVKAMNNLALQTYYLMLRVEPISGLHGEPREQPLYNGVHLGYSIQILQVFW